ncbi:hypothetical protein [Parasediminibacterium sp. JCM 36343]|uniref:hypothetical protein n=1 Tax=Parasediminibacterium sp. JCM 36343 TaxID=3374279 RepID=UPI00397B4A55
MRRKGEIVSSGRQYWSDKEVSDFRKRLKQVIRWTEKLSTNFDFENGFYGTVFRQTNPIIDGTNLYSFFEGDYASWNLDDNDNILYGQLLEIAINSRDIIDDFNLSNIDNLGRIICFQTCSSGHDGAAIVECKHFVDEGDVPPIDTWFFLNNNYYHNKYCSRQTLFCWIPKKFEEVMQTAINVEVFDSYSWLDNNDIPMYDLIKNDS